MEALRIDLLDKQGVILPHFHEHGKELNYCAEIGHEFDIQIAIPYVYGSLLDSPNKMLAVAVKIDGQNIGYTRSVSFSNRKDLSKFQLLFKFQITKLGNFNLVFTEPVMLREDDSPSSQPPPTNSSLGTIVALLALVVRETTIASTASNLIHKNDKDKRILEGKKFWMQPSSAVGYGTRIQQNLVGESLQRSHKTLITGSMARYHAKTSYFILKKRNENILRQMLWKSKNFTEVNRGNIINKVIPSSENENTENDTTKEPRQLGTGEKRHLDIIDLTDDDDQSAESSNDPNDPKRPKIS